MPLAIDTGTVLRAMADHADAFPAVQGEIAEFARKALIKQVKAKDLGLGALRALCAAIHEANFRMFLDDLQPGDLNGVAKRLDPHNAVLKSGSDQDIRNSLVALASGNAEPQPATEKPVKTMRSKPADPNASKMGEVLGSKVHSGRAKGAKSGKTGSSASAAEDGPKPKRQPRAGR